MLIDWISSAKAALDTTIRDSAESLKNLDQGGFGRLVSSWLGIFMWLIGIITFIMIMYSAYLFMSAGANEKNAARAKQFLLWGIIGAVILVLSLAITSFSESLLLP